MTFAISTRIYLDGYVDIDFSLGNFAKAEACYRRALELKPDHAHAHSNLGAVLLDQGIH